MRAGSGFKGRREVQRSISAFPYRFIGVAFWSGQPLARVHPTSFGCHRDGLLACKRHASGSQAACIEPGETIKVKTNLHADAGSAGDAGDNSTVVIDPAAAAKGSDKNGAGQADICGVYRGNGVGGMGGTGGKLCPVGMPGSPGSTCIPLRGCLRQRVRSRFRGGREVQSESELF